MIIKVIKISSAILIVLLVVGILFAQSCSSAEYVSEDIKMNKIENSKNFKDGKFRNYQKNPDDMMNIWKIIPTAWEFLTKDNDRKPDVKLPVQKVEIKNITNTKRDELIVTWIGHSSIIINIGGKILLTDPVFDNKTVFLGPSRYNGIVPINIDELPQIDLVLISHNHYDHLNTMTIEKIHTKVKQFIVPLMVGAELENMGVDREKIIELDWWEEVILFDELLIALTPSQHFSGRGIFDRDETLWGSYVIKGPHQKIFFSGDSGYFEGFKQIGDKYGPFDYTFMECGAYNEKWHFVHMYPEETVQAHIDLKGKILQPIHLGTFDLALHAWYDPMIRVAKAADSLGIKLSTPIVGETFTIDENLITERWWEDLIKDKEIKVNK
jgi:L-ascorbate metabolism protein UlaG (beta-lactamase superfamily)